MLAWVAPTDAPGAQNDAATQQNGPSRFLGMAQDQDLARDQGLERDASVKLTVAVDGVGPWGVYHASPEGREVCFIATAETSGASGVYLYINLWRDAPNGPEAMAYLNAVPNQAVSADLEAPGGVWSFFTENRDFWWPRLGDQSPLIDALSASEHASLALLGQDGSVVGRYEFDTASAAAALDRALMICGLVS